MLAEAILLGTPLGAWRRIYRRRAFPAAWGIKETGQVSRPISL